LSGPANKLHQNIRIHGPLSLSCAFAQCAYKHAHMGGRVWLSTSFSRNLK
jgi:hypothetical protein